MGLGVPVHAQTLRQKVEVEHGVDGVIIFRVEDEIKIGWYEAKRPRVAEANYPWDYIPRTKDISHFSEQIIRQHKWDGTLALWEMFFNDQADGFASPPFEAYGSTCVWHNNAYKFMISEGLIHDPWTTDKLKRLLTFSSTNFYSVIYSILSCTKGTRLYSGEGGGYINVYNPTNDNDSIRVPFPEDIGKELNPDNYDARINTFMKEYNIAGYVFVDLKPPFNIQKK